MFCVKEIIGSEKQENADLVFIYFPPRNACLKAYPPESGAGSRLSSLTYSHQYAFSLTILHGEKTLY